MKKTVSSLALLSLLAFTCYTAQAQKVVKNYYDWGRTKLKEVYTVNAVGQINGIAKTYTEDGMLKEELTYKNNQFNGVSKKYNTRSELINTPEAQRVFLVCNYLNGEKNGLETTYDYFYNGKTFDEWLKIARQKNSGWSDDASIKDVENCLKKGKNIKISETTYAEGTKVKSSTFYPTGKVKDTETYQDGVLQKTVSYYENGKVQSEDNLNGTYKSYYENGKAEYVYNQKGGKRDGKMELFDLDGSLIAVGNYKDDEPFGDFSVNYSAKGFSAYHTNGKAVFKRSFTITDSKEGFPATAYYLTGEKLDEVAIGGVGSYWESRAPLKSETNYVGYYKNGKKKQEGKLKAGTHLYYVEKNNELELDMEQVGKMMLGTWKFYDTNGNIINERSF